VHDRPPPVVVERSGAEVAELAEVGGHQDGACTEEQEDPHPEQERQSDEMLAVAESCAHGPPPRRPKERVGER
jgi:hypothetical protein